MRVAIEGCAHGELEKIYETIEDIERKKNYKIDLLICCGDFQAARNLDDLQTMAIPEKYQDICSFYKYYSGEKEAPVLTIFIGGNHEASNYLQELPYGGWVAPKIYYLGYAGVIKVNGLRIGGISGIYKGYDYHYGRPEFSPYSESTKRSVYHVRELDVFRLKQLSGLVDVFLSHDWPRGIYNHGDKKELIKSKPHLRYEIRGHTLGSTACEKLLETLQPSFWFAAHLHCKFTASVQHRGSNRVTKFLALDKCLPKRSFLEILEFESEYAGAGIKLEYDLEWITILFLTNNLINAKSTVTYMPKPNGSTRFNFTPTDEEKELVRAKFNYDLKIPDNFLKTAKPYNPHEETGHPQQPNPQINPQTSNFCNTLGINDPLIIAILLHVRDLRRSTTFEGNKSERNMFDFSGDQLTRSLNLSQSRRLKRKTLTTMLPKPMCDEKIPEEILLEEEKKFVTNEEEPMDNSLETSDSKKPRF